MYSMKLQQLMPPFSRYFFTRGYFVRYGTLPRQETLPNGSYAFACAMELQQLMRLIFSVGYFVWYGAVPGQEALPNGAGDASADKLRRLDLEAKSLTSQLETASKQV